LQRENGVMKAAAKLSKGKICGRDVGANGSGWPKENREKLEIRKHRGR
jgi:hypothetical protein